MREAMISRVLPAVFAALAAISLMGCSESESGQRFTMVGEEREVRGTVTDAKLTLCAPTPDEPGTCEGTLTVQPAGAGEAGRIAIEVTRNVRLMKDGQPVFLPQLRGTQAIIKYRASQEGPSVATSVTASS